MVVMIVIAVVLVFTLAVLLVRKSDFGNTATVDKLREVDPQAAENVENWRAEEGIRGMSRRF